MARGTLSLEAVQDALKAVLERGEYPSMAKVRLELDTTASQQTLTGHMRIALKGLAEQMGTGLPDGLPRSVVDAAHRFYGEARDSAREELEKQRALMTEREKTLTDELADANQKANALEQQVGQLQQRAQGTETEVASLNKHLEVNGEALNDSQDSNTRLNAELEDARSQAARHIRQLRAAHRKQVENLTRERDETAVARDREIGRTEDQQKTWAKQIDEARQVTRAAESEHAKQMKTLGDERDQALSQRDANAASIQDRERVMERLNSDLDRNREKVSDLEKTVRQSAHQATSLSEHVTNMQSEHNALREKLAGVTAIADERERLLGRLQRARISDKNDDKDAPKKKR